MVSLTRVTGFVKVNARLIFGLLLNCDRDSRHILRSGRFPLLMCADQSGRECALRGFFGRRNDEFNFIFPLGDRFHGNGDPSG